MVPLTLLPPTPVHDNQEVMDNTCANDRIGRGWRQNYLSSIIQTKKKKKNVDGRAGRSILRLKEFCNNCYISYISYLLACSYVVRDVTM